MSEGRRAARVGKLIQEELAGMLIRGLKDPRLEMVSITGVELSDDLQFARIFFCVYGPEEKKMAALEGFKSALGFIRRELKIRLKLRKTPEIVFEFDGSFDYGDRIEKLLKEAAGCTGPAVAVTGDGENGGGKKDN